jgi:hypothetical protein
MPDFVCDDVTTLSFVSLFFNLDCVDVTTLSFVSALSFSDFPSVQRQVLKRKTGNRANKRKRRYIAAVQIEAENK